MIGGPVFIPVHYGGSVWDYAWVDALDAERVSSYRWVRACNHALSSGRIAHEAAVMPSVAMHRFILGLKPGDRVVHHINEDGIDNRRRNLKIVADKFAHGFEPHPRRNLRCGHHDVPPHERELVLAAREAMAAA